MQKIILLLIFVVFTSVQASLPHNFHFSKCQIEYSEAEQTLQISMQLFIDDLELALEEKGHKSLFLCSEKEIPTAEGYLLNYLKETFQIEVNKTKTAYAFVGRETSEDLANIWCYFEVTGVASLDHITVKNSTLTEIYDDQKNVIQVKGPNGKKGYFLLNKQNKAQSIAFSKY